MCHPGFLNQSSICFTIDSGWTVRIRTSKVKEQQSKTEFWCIDASVYFLAVVLLNTILSRRKAGQLVNYAFKVFNIISIQGLWK